MTIIAIQALSSHQVYGLLLKDKVGHHFVFESKNIVGISQLLDSKDIMHLPFTDDIHDMARILNLTK